MTQPYPSRDADKFVVRLPNGMRNRIAAAARFNHRSMNNEIVHHLARALGETDKATTGVKFGDRAPAAAQNETALQGGPITHGIGAAADV